MRICFMTPCLFSMGGVQRVLSCLSNELCERGHEVTIMTIDKPEDEDRSLYALDPRIDIEFVPLVIEKQYLRRAVRKWIHVSRKVRPVSPVWEWAFLSHRECEVWLRKIEQHRFDCIIAVHGWLSCMLGKISDKIDAKCLIGWQHSSFEAYFENRENRSGYWNEGSLFRKYLPHLTHNVVLNLHDKGRYEADLGIPSNVIHNPKSFRSSQVSPLERKRFVAVGRLCRAKGFDLLIPAFAQFHQLVPDWSLDIFGDGESRAALQQLIDEQHAGNYIKLCGWTDNVQSELLDSSGLLLSSRWEGMPMTVLEALELGVPVVSFGITAVEPLITDGVEGRVVPPYDIKAFASAAAELARDEKRRKEMGRNAKKKSEAFDVSTIADQWERLFSGVKTAK